MNWRDCHVGYDQFRVLDLVGVLLLKRRPSDLRVDDKSGTFAGWIERDGLRPTRRLLRIKHVTAIAHLHLGFEMRGLEMVIADLKHLPERHIAD